jgi:hypothetical protein
MISVPNSLWVCSCSHYILLLNIKVTLLLSQLHCLGSPVLHTLTCNCSVLHTNLSLKLHQANARTVPQVGHDSFLPSPLQFSLHQSSYHLTLYSLWYWKYSSKNVCTVFWILILAFLMGTEPLGLNELFPVVKNPNYVLCLFTANRNTQDITNLHIV